MWVTKFQLALHILELLPECNAQQIARKLRLHPRTVYRRIEDLRELGFNLVYDETTYRWRIVPAAGFPDWFQIANRFLP